MATTVMAYERWDASAYALEWYDSYNTGEYYKANLDCTNFVSQCLEAGGMKRSSSLPSYGSTKHWRPHSYTWENATGFREYWKEQELGIYDYMQDVEILMNTIDAVIEEVNAGNIPEEVLNESRERMEKLQELHDSYERKIEEEDYTDVENLYNCLREEFDYISETYR